MILRRDEGLRVIRMRWRDRGAERDCEADFAFSEKAWDAIKRHPLLEAFNSGEGMGSAMKAVAGDQIVMPCRGGGAIVFKVGAKMWFGGGLDTHRPCMVKLSFVSVMVERLVDYFQRLPSSDQIRSEAEEERRVRAESRRLAIASIEARDKAKAEAKAKALAEERALLEKRGELDARVEARLDRILSGGDLSDADLDDIDLESIQSIGATAPAEPEVGGGHL